MGRRDRSGGLAGIVLVVALLLAVPSTAANSFAQQPELTPHRLRVPIGGGVRDVTLWLPDGFEIGVAASGLPSARMLAQSPSGELVLSQHFAGKIVKLADPDGDGTVDEVTTILSNLYMPHGVAFIGEALYVAESDKVLRLDPWWDGSSARRIATLPGGGHHETRTLAAGHDGTLYVSVGSSCDACEEEDPLRAAIWRLDPESGELQPFARGIRNAVGLTVGPDGTTLWATENERNELGEQEPPDEVLAVRPGGDYGWPSCYGDRVAAPGLGTPERCAGTEAPTVPLPAHIAPLGLTFYTADRFPSAYHDNLFVALHGSALRDDPVGYEVARVVLHDGVPTGVQTFVRGWLVQNDSWGRPVAPFVARDGTLLVTDDKAGVIYWIRPAAEDGADDDDA